ncbi:MAG: hypothetical protein R3E89_10415 [Thiolinea sp.]
MFISVEFSLAPVILVVLGNLFEDNLRRALSRSGGDWGVLVQSWNSVVLYILAVLVVMVPLWLGHRRARKPA